MAAGNATIGALRVTLAADTADLDKGLKSAQASLAAFAGLIGGFAGAIGAQFANALGEIPKTFTNIINDMEKLNKESQKLGISVEELSKLSFAADLADVSFEALSKGMVKFAKAITESVKDPTSEAAKTFQQLGVSINDLKTLSVDQIFAKAADGFSEFQEGAGKTTAAVTLFGKAGANLIPLLNEGKDGLSKLKDEAQSFGNVISTGAAKAAEDFNDNITRLGKITKGVFIQALSDVLPTMAEFSAQLVEAKKNSSFLELGTIALSTGLKALLTVVIQANSLFNQLTTSISTLVTALAFASTGGFSKALDAINKGLADSSDIATKAREQIVGLWNGSTKAANESKVATEANSGATKQWTTTTEVAKSALDSFIASQQKGLASRQAEIATFGQLAGAQAAMKIQLDAEAIAKSNNITMTATQIAQLEQLKNAYAAAANTLQGLQITQENQTGAEKLIDTQKKLSELLAANAISAETFGRAMTKAAESAGATWNQVASNVLGSFSQLFTELAKKNKEWAVAAKAFAIAEATINTYTAFTKALSAAPPPLNFALAAATLAAGLAKVIAISSTNIPSAATGFSSVVPGGLGGGDSKLFQALVEPGEQIDVIPNSQNRSGGRNASAPSVVHLTIPHVTTREALRDIIEGLNDMIRDGYRLNVVPT